MKTFFFNWVLPRLLCCVLNIWCGTLRVYNQYPENDPVLNGRSGKYILALWHSRIFYLLYYFRNRPDLHILISPSRDGDILANFGRLLGYSIIRGSSFKKAIPAARSLIKVLRKNQQVAIVADGSRGPRQKAQSGFIQISARSASEIIPMGFDARSKIVLKSWDRFILPLPFSKCVISFGKPIKVSRKDESKCLEDIQRQLEDRLNYLSVIDWEAKPFQ
tara:strand:+ start:89 stop:745 length:657 start_codon:yes stop_codon:yes gene_type:complete